MKISSLFILAMGILTTLTAFDSSALVGGPPAKNSPLFAILHGGNEVSNSGQAAAGDVNGRGSATIILHSSDTVCFAIIVSKIDAPSAAHIHEATAGVNGPIVVTLDPPDAGDPGTASGCVSGLDAALVKKIKQQPAGFYINVHNPQFPGGALRGQLF